jgi:hypothetical protein
MCRISTAASRALQKIDLATGWHNPPPLILIALTTPELNMPAVKVYHNLDFLNYRGDHSQIVPPIHPVDETLSDF